MFTLNWNDPQTFWLNVTNWVLLLATVAAIAVLAIAVAREVLKRMQIGVREPLDVHSAAYPDLGYTMADGGKSIQPKKRNPRG